MAKFKFIENGKEMENKEHRSNGNLIGSNAAQELIDFKRLFSLLTRHKWLILFFVVLSVSASFYLVNYYMLPRYSSQATILISTSQNNMPAGDGSLGRIVSESFNPNLGTGSVNNAIYLFQSRELASEVAQQIQDIETQPNGNLYPILWQNYPEDISTVSNEQLASRIRSGLNVEPVEPGSDMLRLTFESYSSYEAARIINISLNVFQQLSLERKQESARNALSFLRDKKQEVRGELHQSEEQLSRYMDERDVVSLESQADNRVNTLAELESEHQSLQLQLESVNASISRREKQLESIRPGLADQYSKAIGPTINNYQQRLAELKAERFVLLSNNPRLKENPESEPELVRLNEQITELENEIQSLSETMLSENDTLGFSGDGNISQELANLQNQLTELRIQRNQLEAQIDILDNRIQESRSFLDQVPESRIQIARLEREVEMHKELYNTISQQEAEMALMEQTQNSSGSIVDYATVNNSPVKPQKPLWLFMGALFGFCLPVGLLLVKDYFTSVIESIDQLNDYPYPLLTVIYDHTLIKKSKKGWLGSKEKGKKSSSVSDDLVLLHHSSTPVAEAYRRLAGKLIYSNPDNIPQTMLITSGGQGEGKTTLTGNMAAALAEIDKKVLIVDCDFRRPAVHKLFGLTTSPGITEVVFGESRIADAIKPTEISNLFVLPRGKSPVSPSKLTASDKFKDVIDVLKSNYDMILFDTPPYGIVSDIAPLVVQSDMIIFTVRFGDTKKKILRHTLDDLDSTFDKSLGIVLTMYKPDKSYDSYETKGLHNYMYQGYYEYEREDDTKRSEAVKK